MYANGPDMKANKGHNTDYNPQHCIVCMWVGSVPIMADLEPWMFTPKRLNAKTVALLKEKKTCPYHFVEVVDPQGFQIDIYSMHATYVNG